VILKLKLFNFRNYREVEYKFGKQTVICGKNGAGKTNLLEAIGICSTTKSFRGSGDNDLVNWDENYYRLEATIKNKNKGTDFLELIFQKEAQGPKKIAKINKVKTGLSNFIGKLKVVEYSFESNDLILDGPAKRRRFLDSSLCQLFPEYTLNLIKFMRIIKNRNHLLYKIRERMAGVDELDFWDEGLISLGLEIVKYRKEFIVFINKNINSFYSYLSDDDKKIELKYHLSGFDSLNDLRSKREQEIRAGLSLYGPHRDDLLFFSDHHKVEDSLSRGEIKSLLFVLKKCEAEYIFDKSSERPVILFDDILAELDENRRKKLEQFIEDNQIIISSTEKTELEGLFGNSEFINL
jgi:DNA replication and repair protein RecF